MRGHGKAPRGGRRLGARSREPGRRCHPGVHVIGVALLDGAAIESVGGDYFVGGSVATWATRLGIVDLLTRAHAE
jgi:hypothetical protein